MNTSARLVFCATKFCHIIPLLHELHWRPVRVRIEFKLLLITFKIVHGMAREYLCDLLSICKPSVYNLRRNNDGLFLDTPLCKSKKILGDLPFMLAAPKLWNSLPKKTNRTR